MYFLTLVNKNIYWYFFFLFEFSIEIEKHSTFTTHDLWLTPSAVLVTGAQLHHFAWMTSHQSAQCLSELRAVGSEQFCSLPSPPLVVS